MERIKEVSKWAVIVTSVVVFIVWEAASSIQVSYFSNSSLNVYLQMLIKYVISLAVSYTFYQFMLNAILSGFLKSSFLKKWFLNKTYVEGTWVSFYYMYGDLRASVEDFVQDFSRVSIKERGYHEDGADQGVTTANACYLSEEGDKLVEAYEDMSKGKTWTPGYSEYMLSSSSGKKVPDRMKGFFFELGMKKKILCIAFKTDDHGMKKQNKNADMKIANNDHRLIEEIRKEFRVEIEQYLGGELNEKDDVFFLTRV